MDPNSELCPLSDPGGGIRRALQTSGERELAILRHAGRGGEQDFRQGIEGTASKHLLGSRIHKHPRLNQPVTGA